jgi:hypothetical protein
VQIAGKEIEDRVRSILERLDEEDRPILGMKLRMKDIGRAAGE